LLGRARPFFAWHGATVLCLARRVVLICGHCRHIVGQLAFLESYAHSTFAIFRDRLPRRTGQPRARPGQRRRHRKRREFCGCGLTWHSARFTGSTAGDLQRRRTTMAAQSRGESRGSRTSPILLACRRAVVPSCRRAAVPPCRRVAVSPCRRAAVSPCRRAAVPPCWCASCRRAGRRASSQIPQPARRGRRPQDQAQLPGGDTGR
jgi:hypothetical protein